MSRARRARAVLAVGLALGRAWALGPALTASVALCLVAMLAGDVYLELPLLRNQTIVLHLVPVLAGMALGFPLVDRTPELTLLARSVVRLVGLRLVGTVVVALPVVACLVAAGWSYAGACVVLGFLGFAALSAALLGLWYWVPFFGLVVVWAQAVSPLAPAGAGPEWAAWSLGALLVAGASYVGIECARVWRVVRATDARSARGRDLDTIRP